MIMIDCIAIGDHAQATEHPRQITCNFVGIGMRTTVMTPEEHAVVKAVILRMFKDDLRLNAEAETKP